MGAGPQGQIVPEGPVVQVMARGFSAKAPGRDFVILVSPFVQQLSPLAIDVPQVVVVGQVRRPAVELGVGFQGQLVPGQVGWLILQSSLDIVQGLLRGLSRQTMHQVDVEIVEAGPPCRVYRPMGGIGVVNAPEVSEMVGVEALDSDGETVYPRFSKRFEAAGFKRARVGFQGDFGIRLEGKSCP